MRGCGAAGFWSDDCAASGEATPIASEATANAMANDAGLAIGRDMDLKRRCIKIGVRTPRSTHAPAISARKLKDSKRRGKQLGDERAFLSSHANLSVTCKGGRASRPPLQHADQVTVSAAPVFRLAL